MAQINPAQERPGQVKKADNKWANAAPLLGTVVGGVLGTLVAPGAGTMAGASLGGMVGGVAQGPLTKPDQVVQGPAAAPTVGTTGAMSRRMQAMEQDPYMQLRQASLALDTAPKEIADQYRAPINDALTIAQKQRQTGMA